jgi:hypothetical protein
MDVLTPFAMSVLAAIGIVAGIGFVAAIAGVESRDGFDRDGRREPLFPLDTRVH